MRAFLEFVVETLRRAWVRREFMVTIRTERPWVYEALALRSKDVAVRTEVLDDRKP